MRSSVLILLLIASSIASGATISDAYSKYMEAGQFQLLREYFTGNESSGRRSILRTDAGVREGQYFIIDFDTRIRDLPKTSELVLEVVSTDDLKPKMFRFDLSQANKTSSRRVFLGVTGDQWPSSERKALAWRVSLLNGEATVSEWKSFLWEMP